jgi:hypothetical protein
VRSVAGIFRGSRPLDAVLRVAMLAVAANTYPGLQAAAAAAAPAAARTRAASPAPTRHAPTHVRCPRARRRSQDVFLVGFLESEVDTLRAVATALNAAGGAVHAAQTAPRAPAARHASDLG